MPAIKSVTSFDVDMHDRVADVSQDYLFDDKCNDEAYNFWREKQSVRVKNEEKKKILFPEKKPHPFGVKRPVSLFTLDPCRFH